jgi:hypothetical protein
MKILKVVATAIGAVYAAGSVLSLIEGIRIRFGK